MQETEALEAARRAVGDPGAELLGWSVAPISHVGIIDTTGGLHLAEGRVLSAGTEVPWSAVVKVVVRGAGDGECLPPSSWCYWRREAAFYASDLPAGLPDGLLAPRSYAVFEAEERAHIWMERVHVTARRWELEDFERAAHAAGRSAGAYVTGRDLPAEPWLCRGFVRSILADGGFWATFMDSASGAAWHSPLADAFGPGVRRRVQALWADRDALFGVIDRLPQVFAHGDLHLRNVLVPPDGGEVVAFDWGFCGPAPVGGDLGDLVAQAAWFCDVDVAALSGVEEAAFAGYRSGLRATGWDGDERLVRLGFALQAAARMGACMPGWAVLMLEGERAASSAALYRRPVDEVLTAWRALAEWSLERADEARALVRATGLAAP
jgi:hypothetical protein